ncbi:F-box protein CPR30-like [Chenopodium quinoa]|uniref:F-box protein CPR30-like n=1 Tax=Chenopodium quinoa TaxID=63459 RepID=UPI000B78437A|nr:F-box protein CPR30-like [Chenopodium quinoa]
MADLPIEIITQILSQLPVKSLLSFLCVCKSWYSLIKNPNFIKLHLNQSLISNSNRHLLLHYSSLHSAELDLEPNRISFSELRHPLKPRKIVIFIGSCNGVVCISDESGNDVFLYNPLTGSHRKLPSIPTIDLDKDCLVYGFGYDSKNDDYKVLMMIQGLKNRKNSRNEAKVYSLKESSWKCVKSIPYYLYYANCNGVLVNEALHYMVKRRILGSKLCKFIASFDLRTESFSLMKCPKYDVNLKTYWLMRLYELGGCLSLFINHHSCDINKLSPYELHDPILESAEVWVMKEHGRNDSWAKVYSIREPRKMLSMVQLKPLVYSDEQRVLLEIDGRILGWYDLKSEKFNEYTIQGMSFEPVGMEYFVGSLVSVEDESRFQSRTLSKKNKKK